MSFDIIVLAFSAVSGLACAWMIYDLLRLPKAARRRLFWVQLMALAITDLVEAVLGVMSGHWPPLGPGSCEFYIYARYTMEFASALIEVQIGAGFAAACLHSERLSRVLRRSLLFSWPLAGLLTLASIAGGLKVVEDIPNNNCNDLYSDNISMWSVVILCLCSASVLLYMWSVCATANTPLTVRRKVLARAAMYVVNFVVTFGLRAVRGFVISDQSTPDFLERLSWLLLCLNGFANVMTYAWQNRSRRARTELSFHVDFAPEAPQRYGGSHATVLSRDPLMGHFTLRFIEDQDSALRSGNGGSGNGDVSVSSEDGY